jgi:hypothetical protein
MAHPAVGKEPPEGSFVRYRYKGEYQYAVYHEKGHTLFGENSFPDGADIHTITFSKGKWTVRRVTKHDAERARKNNPWWEPTFLPKEGMPFDELQAAMREYFKTHDPFTGKPL